MKRMYSDIPEKEAAPDGKRTLSAKNARQGHTGDHVGYILGWSIAAVTAVFLLILLERVL
jgi:hypothetical protein